MYTFLIAGVLTFIILTCLFRKNRSNGNVRTTMTLIFLGAIIASLTIITYYRLPYLEQEVVVAENNELSKHHISTDTVAAYFVDTVKTDNEILIRKNEVELTDTTANLFEVNKNTGIVFCEDSSLYIKYVEDDETYKHRIPNTGTIHFDDENRLIKQRKQYVPDEWTAWFIPKISDWYEIHLTVEEFEKARENYPKLTRSWKTLPHIINKE